jgi:hypothetical protein
MHRTQIYLDDELHNSLKARSRIDGVSMSELIRRTLQAHVQPSPLVDAQAFFQRLQPLESLAHTAAGPYVRALRQRSRLLHADAPDPVGKPK